MKDIEDSSLEVQELLGRLHEETPSPEEKQRLLLAQDALRFISATGQLHGFEHYRKSLDDKAPPLVIAAFDTHEEAEAWLKAHPEPPHNANVLIAGKYHTVVHSRERNRRYLPPSPVIEFYLEDMISNGLPSPAAAFSTREEAEAWLNSQPEPPRQVFITIAGEYYLTAYHYRIKLRALYPISLAAKSEEKNQVR
jgi:ABC-type nitrate/sulfonate/bicarbonate transport system substrate-binding protein